ncbi:MAG: DUF2779 domain-containing protein [Bacteroidia bacterium]|nr:DUF2779 domain-containing protein [Bacteroidia bacterium]
MPNHKITKTDFLGFLKCQKSIWLKKNKPQLHNEPEIDPYEMMLIKGGEEVEILAKELFPGHHEFSLGEDQNNILSKISETASGAFYQPSFVTEENLFARVDFLEKLEDGTFHLIEVKSSKNDKPEHHKDLAFQKYVLEKNGLTISKTSIILLNGDYTLETDQVIPEQLLLSKDVTEVVNSIKDQTEEEINEAVRIINLNEIDESSCSCLHNTKRNHCSNFEYFNGTLPPNSVFDLSGIRIGRLQPLINQGIRKIKDIPDRFTLSPKQNKQRKSLLEERPIVDWENIKEILSSLQYPLHFIDYEAYSSAIPKLVDTKAHQHLVFQVSIHTLTEDGTLTHHEYVSDQLEKPDSLLESMKNFTGLTGTFISWNKTYETSRNKEMKELAPAYGEYLDYINDNMFDLMNIFKSDYIDFQFQGSASIKKVLPVIIPELSYEDLQIQNGTTANEQWERLAIARNLGADQEQVRLNLLEYCKRDTLAMVKIFQFLQNQITN